MGGTIYGCFSIYVEGGGDSHYIGSHHMGVVKKRIGTTNEPPVVLKY